MKIKMKINHHFYKKRGLFKSNKYLNHIFLVMKALFCNDYYSFHEVEHLSHAIQNDRTVTLILEVCSYY